MKKMLSMLGGLAVFAFVVAVPVRAEMVAVSDSDLDTVSGKGTAIINFGAYEWTDNHNNDSADQKGALANEGTIILTGINTANVWGAYAGADAFGTETCFAACTTSADATANLAIGGF